jgi:glycosyltransferase involved in cell wall biosynthesis
MKEENFSVLLSVYDREKPEYLNLALESIWVHQILKPSEIVVVEDGPLNRRLLQVLQDWEEKLEGIFKRVAMPKNKGLGDALNIGVEHCSFDFIARMDTDDIACKYRFQKQIQFMEKHPEIDILGGAVAEFADELSKPHSVRSLPTLHSDIVKFSKTRNPFNHPTVIYRKDAVLKAGNYQKFLGLEDYYLWVRMICNGSKCANLPDTVVFMRAGLEMLGRRGGLKYAVNDLRMQKKLREMRHISVMRFFGNVFIRVPVRLMPIQARKKVYSLIRSRPLNDKKYSGV